MFFYVLIEILKYLQFFIQLISLFAYTSQIFIYPEKMSSYIKYRNK